MLKSTQCFSRGPELGFQYLHSVAHSHLYLQFQSPLAPVGTCTAVLTHVHMIYN